MIASEFLSRSKVCCQVLHFTLRKNEKPSRISSRLVTGKTTQGEKPFHIHRVYTELPAEILQCFAEHCCDVYPLLFEENGYTVQTTTLETAALTLVSTVATSALARAKISG